MNERIKPAESDIARECILDALEEHGQLSLSTLLEVECRGVDRNVAERTVHKLQSLGKIRLNPFSKWELAPPPRDARPEAVVEEQEHGRDTEPAPPMGDHSIPLDYIADGLGIDSAALKEAHAAIQEGNRVLRRCNPVGDQQDSAETADLEPSSSDLPDVPRTPTPSELPHPFEDDPVAAEVAAVEWLQDPKHLADALAEAQWRFGSEVEAGQPRPDGLFTAACFSGAVAKLTGLDVTLEGSLVRSVLVSARCVEEGGGYFRAPEVSEPADGDFPGPEDSAALALPDLPDGGDAPGLPPPRTIDDVARRVADKPPRDVLADAADLGLRVSFELEQTRGQRQQASADLGRAKAELSRARAAEEQALAALDSLLQRETRLERLASALAGATG